MKRIFGNTPEAPFPGTQPVVTIGMFDGVHLGHQKVIQSVITQARELQAPALALTFDVHPRTLFGKGPKLICSLEHRLRLLESLGLDAVCILSFTPQLATVTAEDFCRSFLLGRLHAQRVVLGSRGRFGRGGEGNTTFINRLGLPLSAVQEEDAYWEGAAISSSAIRSAVESGNLELASSMLGRRVSVLGTVMPGRQIGRTIGFPTLNIDPHHELHPPRGVYATRACCGDTCWDSITNIGHRPTIENLTPEDILIETHLFDYSGNLYNQNVEVFFMEKVREERRFPSLAALQEQISCDVGIARAVLNKI